MHQLWPFAGSVWQDPKTLTRQVWDGGTARAIPGVGRALALYGGMIGGCPMDAVRGDTVLRRPRILERPDPDREPSSFVSLNVEDYLLHGNACSLITVRDATGWPAAMRWFPSWRWSITLDAQTGQPVYWLDGREVNRANVVHVRRGADPAFEWRGVGVVEQHLRTLNRAGLQEAYESENLTNRGMPAVAVITPNDELDPADADAAADKWLSRFSGTEGRPGIFPKGTQVIPLSWNPEQGQVAAARNLTTKDLANLFNLDGYFLGAEGSSHTYRSPGLMSQFLLKTSLLPVMRVFQDAWSYALLVAGQSMRFDTTDLIREDLLTMVQAFTQGRWLWPDPNEPRQYMGWPALPDDAFATQTPAPPSEPASVGADDPVEDSPVEPDPATEGVPA